MTKLEHLQRIRAKCVENLAIAEKRTPGQWTEYRVSSGASEGGLCFGAGTMQTPPPRQLQMMRVDAAFITACAGAAEAGWRSTIAAIDALDAAHISLPDGNDAAWNGIEAIIAAWPEELL